MHKGNILVVDDDRFFRVRCSDVLKEAGYAVATATSGEEALDLVETKDFDVVITDLVMPGMDGLAVLEGVRRRNALIDVIIVTGHSTIESAVTALKNGAFDYITKPVNDDVLLHTLASCLEKKHLIEENQEIRQSLKLFEVSWQVSKTLDQDKLHEASLDAILQVVPCEAGALIRYDCANKLLRIKAVRHTDKKTAASIVRTMISHFGEGIKNSQKIVVLREEELNEEERAGLAGYGAVMVVPIVAKDRPTGFLVVLRKAGAEPWSTKDRKRASFVAGHISISYENARKYEEAQQLIFVDSLTNLYNSKYLHKILEKELQRSSRLNLPVSLLFIDIDDFKKVNDTNDHLVGSKVLVEMGETILRCVREVDTVVRYGGDEYVVILVDAGYDQALLIAERIRSTVEETVFQKEEGLNIKLTVSIGVATYPVHTRDRKQLIKIADKAMYKAKDAAKNCVYLAPVPDDAKRA